MFNSSPIVVGLEIGTSKTCVAVGELGDGGGVNIIGLGQSVSHGVRKGEIPPGNLLKNELLRRELATRDTPFTEITAEDIRSAIVQAEDMANREIQSVFLGVSGGHIESYKHCGSHRIASDDRTISPEDEEDVVKNAKAINLSVNKRQIHLVRQHFTVDGMPGILNPVGMCGSLLQLDMHVVHGDVNRLQTPIDVVEGLQLGVETIFFNGLASALAVLGREQKEQGVLVLDLGAGTTDYVVYAGGIVRHTGVLAVGGNHFTNDIACGLKISHPRAELLKIEHGSAYCDKSCRDREIPVLNQFGLPEKSLSLERLRRITSLRAAETLEAVEQKIIEAGMLPHIQGGIVLCGGGSRLDGIERLAADVFGVPATRGRSVGLTGPDSVLDQPEFATAIGLVRCGAFEVRRRRASRPTLSARVRQLLSQLLSMF